MRNAGGFHLGHNLGAKVRGLLECVVSSGDEVVSVVLCDVD